MPVDRPGAEAYLAEITEKMDAVRRILQTQARRRGLKDFNPGSHPQVRKLLQSYGIRVRKRTKGTGQMSTSEKALSGHVSHPFVAGVQEYRELKKLRGTYLIPLLESLT